MRATVRRKRNGLFGQRNTQHLLVSFCKDGQNLQGTLHHPSSAGLTCPLWLDPECMWQDPTALLHVRPFPKLRGGTSCT